MSKIDWRQRNYGQTIRELSQKSRQEKLVAQTSVVMEKKEKWIEGGIDKTWWWTRCGLGNQGPVRFWHALLDDSMMSLNSWCRGSRTILSIPSLHAKTPLNTCILSIHVNIMLTQETFYCLLSGANHDHSLPDLA